MLVTFLKAFFLVILILLIAIVIVAIVLLLIISLSKVKIDIVYKFNKTENFIIIRFFIKKHNLINIYRNFKDTEDKDPEKNKYNLKKLIKIRTKEENRKLYRKIFFKNRSKILKYLKDSNMRVNLLNTKINIGVGQADYTAITSGYVYSILGIIYSFISTSFKIEKKRFFVKCYFNDLRLDIHFNCIVQVKGANIIKGISKTVFYIKKKKKEVIKNERTSYSRSYEHCNGKHT